MMSPKKKCSYKRNKTAKKSRFRKGHPHLPPKVEKGVDNETDSSDEVPQRIVSQVLMSSLMRALPPSLTLLRLYPAN